MCAFSLPLSQTKLMRYEQAKNAFDHLNGFHLQERYLVGGSFTGGRGGRRELMSGVQCFITRRQNRPTRRTSHGGKRRWRSRRRSTGFPRRSKGVWRGREDGV